MPYGSGSREYGPRELVRDEIPRLHPQQRARNSRTRVQQQPAVQPVLQMILMQAND